MVRTSEPAPDVPHRPQIAVVLLAAGEQKIFAVGGPRSRRLSGRLIPARQNRVGIISFCTHLPEGLRAVFVHIHGESNISAVRRPSRRARVSVHLKELAQLRPIATNRIQIMTSYENNLSRIRRPCRIVTGRFPKASWLATLNRPEPERHFFIAPRKLPD